MNCITNSKIYTLTTFFFSNLRLNSLQAALYRYSYAFPCIIFLSNPETLSLSKFTFKIFEVYREKGKQISVEFYLFSLVWFDWVLFVNGSIVIGWDEVIREYCTRSNRRVGKRVTNKICFFCQNMKFEYLLLSVPYKSSRNWPRIGRPDLETVDRF